MANELTTQDLVLLHNIFGNETPSSNEDTITSYFDESEISFTASMKEAGKIKFLHEDDTIKLIFEDIKATVSRCPQVDYDCSGASPSGTDEDSLTEYYDNYECGCEEEEDCESNDSLLRLVDKALDSVETTSLTYEKVIITINNRKIKNEYLGTKFNFQFFYRGLELPGIHPNVHSSGCPCWGALAPSLNEAVVANSVLSLFGFMMKYLSAPNIYDGHNGRNQYCLQRVKKYNLLIPNTHYIEELFNTDIDSFYEKIELLRKNQERYLKRIDLFVYHVEYMKAQVASSFRMNNGIAMLKEPTTLAVLPGLIVNLLTRTLHEKESEVYMKGDLKYRLMRCAVNFLLYHENQDEDSSQHWYNLFTRKVYRYEEKLDELKTSIIHAITVVSSRKVVFIDIVKNVLMMAQKHPGYTLAEIISHERLQYGKDILTSIYIEDNTMTKVFDYLSNEEMIYSIWPRVHSCCTIRPKGQEYLNFFNELPNSKIPGLSNDCHTWTAVGERMRSYHEKKLRKISEPEEESTLPEEANDEIELIVDNDTLPSFVNDIPEPEQQSEPQEETPDD